MPALLSPWRLIVHLLEIEAAAGAIVVALLLVHRAAVVALDTRAIRRTEGETVARWLARRFFASDTVADVIDQCGGMTLAQIELERAARERGYAEAVADAHERHSRAARRSYRM